MQTMVGVNIAVEILLTPTIVVVKMATSSRTTNTNVLVRNY